MIASFDPGQGWRQTDGLVYDAYEGAGKITHWDGESWSYWVRVDPVPPLPTEPYTVIRVTWLPEFTGEPDAFVLRGRWNDHPEWESFDNVLGPNNLQARITGFVVLAEPRAVTAKAVLDRLGELDREGYTDPDEIVYREFGVES